MSVSERIKKLEQQQAQDDRVNRTARLNEYARLLSIENPTADELAELHALAQRLNRRSSDVEADHAAIQEWNHHTKVLAPAYEAALDEQSYAQRKIERIGTEGLAAAKREEKAARLKSDLETQMRQVLSKCTGSVLFKVDPHLRTVDTLFDTEPAGIVVEKRNTKFG